MTSDIARVRVRYAAREHMEAMRGFYGPAWYRAAPDACYATHTAVRLEWALNDLMRVTREELLEELRAEKEAHEGSHL